VARASPKAGERLMPIEKHKMKEFYNNSSVYQNAISDLAHYHRDESLARYAAIVRSFSRGTRVIDLGCGTGESTRRLRSKGLRAIGVDISLLFLRTSTDDAADPRDFVSADISRLPFRSASVDCVALHDVIEHIPDVERLLEESLRVLRPNGRVIIVSPNLLSPLKPLRHLLGIEGFNVKFYGSSFRTFLAIFENLFWNLRNTISRQPHFRFREPILEEFQCPDDDTVFLANYLDLRNWFEIHAVKTQYHQLKPDTKAISGRIKSGLLALFPWIDKGFVLIAERDEDVAR